MKLWMFKVDKWFTYLFRNHIKCKYKLDQLMRLEAPFGKHDEMSYPIKLDL